jgi:hypothetical protein
LAADWHNCKYSLGEKMMMIHDYAADIASQMGIQKLKVTITNGSRLGCRDMHLVSFVSNTHLVSELIHHSELDHLRNGIVSDRIEMKIRSALDRLKSLQES